MEEAVALLEFNEISASEALRPELYAELMVCYLLQNDLSNAKFLWKRTPSEAKANEELTAVWRVGQKLWLKDMPGFYCDVRSFPWSPNISNMMKQLMEFQREKNMKLIELAYTTITPQDVSKYLGVTIEEATEVAKGRGWSFDDGVYLPKEQPIAPVHISSAEAQLGKLTDYVTVLEN